MLFCWVCCFSKKRILVFIRPSTNNTLHCRNRNAFKLITWLKLGLSHFPFKKFNHGIQDTLDLIYNCCTVETSNHYLLQCASFSNESLTIFNKLQSIDENVLSKKGSNISNVLFFGERSFSAAKKYFCFNCYS